MLDLIEFPDPLVEVISFINKDVPDMDAGSELPTNYSHFVLLNSVTTTELDMVVRESRYVIECRATSTPSQSADASSAALGSKLASVLSAWARSGEGPARYQLISLVDSFPDADNRARSILTVSLIWHAL